MELELKNIRKKVARVRDISRDVILCSRIEKFFATLGDGSNALVLQTKVPPRFVVIVRFDFSGKHFPSPLIDQQAEREKSDLLQRTIQQQSDVARSVRCFLQQPDLYEIFRRDGQCDGV